MQPMVFSVFYECCPVLNERILANGNENPSEKSQRKVPVERLRERIRWNKYPNLIENDRRGRKCHSFHGMAQFTIQQAFSRALQLQQSGRLPEAQRLYEQILNHHPRHFRAMHCLGRIAYQEGRFDVALDLLERSLALEPNSSEANLDLGNMLLHQGRLDEAVAAYRRAIMLRSDWADAYHNLGIALKALEQINEAITNFENAIALNPNLPEVHHKLGLALYETTEFDRAIASFERVTALDPDNASAHAILGDRLRERGQIDRALLAYQRAIALKPEWAEAHNSLGEALRNNGELVAAIAEFRHAISLRPDFAQAHNNLGNALKDAGYLDDAVTAYQTALDLDSTLAEAACNLGIALREAGNTDAAEAAFRRAIAIRPNYAGAHTNLGACLREQGRLDEAIASCRRAISFQPDLALAHFNLAMSLLADSDLAAGWEEYEWRWKCRDFPSKERGFAQPQWDGGDLENRTLLLHAEQGFGDSIQFIRYLPAVVQHGGSIIVECQPELHRLLEGSFSRCQIIPRGQPLPAFDLHCPLLTLPRIFKTTLASIPAEVPYLIADPILIDLWRSKLNSSEAGLKIGLAWAGNPTFSSDPTRSLSLDRLAPLAEVRGAIFYSLQKGYAAPQAARLPAGLRLIDLSPELHDFADTAAVISLMDLVITTDTSVAHLAGALGAPVWTLLRFAPDWRWQMVGEYCPWYPSMRLFRQSTKDDWEEVIQRVAQVLCVQIFNTKGLSAGRPAT
jgi:tetratricopeptide (TPR) repeat protein